MNHEFKRENKYLVLKWDDINKYLDINERDWIDRVVYLLNSRRYHDGKNNNTYVVVNEDEPYAEKVWSLIEEHWEVKQ